MIIGRYIGLGLCRSAGIVLLLLVVLFSFLALADALEDVGKGSYSTADAIAVVILTMPTRVIDLLPVATLLGSVIGLGIMANHRELVAMRAAGMSAWHIAGVLSLLAGALSLVAVIVQFFVIPVAERQAQEFRSHTLERSALGSGEFWSRRGNRVIRVGAVDFGRIPRSIEIYELDNHGRLSRMLSADKADIVGASHWLLYDVDEKVLSEQSVSYRHLDSLNWNSFLSPDQLSTLIAPAYALSVVDLYQYLRESADSGIDTREHQALLWRQVALPIALFAMMLLGLPLVLNSVRSRSSGFRTLIGAAIGVAFYLFEQITGQLAILFDLQPAATALAPAVLVLSAALAAIWRGV